jgi:uncharacterized protein (TIGR03089 family)
MPPVPNGDVPRAVGALLAGLLRADPGRPRVTWYGPDGDRVELSARTLDNWVAKAANLLVEEYDAGPGTFVDVRLPGHWRTVTWLLATWVVGAGAAVGGDRAGDVLVTDDPAAAVADGAEPSAVVAVALPALATSFGAGLPTGVLDGTAEVRLRGDVFVPLVAPTATDTALVLPTGPLTHGELLPAARDVARAAGWPAQVRLLTPAGPGDAVTAVLAPLLLDGSVVLHSPALDADRLDRIAEQERTTARHG